MRALKHKSRIIGGISVATILFSVFVALWLSHPMFSAWWEYPRANLRVDVTITGLANVTLGEASIKCPLVDVVDINTLPPWTKWCGEHAVNESLALDSHGSISLWFNVSPSPRNAQLAKPDDSPAPRIELVYPNGAAGTYRPELVTLDHWQLIISLVR